MATSGEQLPALLKDEELCDLLRISRSTLVRHLKDGPPTVMQETPADVRTIKRISLGGERRWLKESVLSFIRGGETQTEEN